jgi:hypothetical protein
MLRTKMAYPLSTLPKASGLKELQLEVVEDLPVPAVLRLQLLEPEDVEVEAAVLLSRTLRPSFGN